MKTQEIVDQDIPHPHGVAYWMVFGVLIPCFLFCTARRSVPLYGQIDHQEEGVRAEAANQYLHGLKPYRDIYLLYGLGDEIVEPLSAFHLFGTRLSSLRRWAWFQDAFGPLALYTAGVALLETPLALLGLLGIILFRNPFWISGRAACALGALCFIFVALRREDRWAWTRAGLSCALAFLYSKESGLLLTMSVVLVLGFQWLREDPRDYPQSLQFFAMGWAFILFPLFVWLAATGGLRFFVHDLLHPAAGYLSTWASPAPALASPLRRFARDPFIFYRPEGAGLRWWFPLLFFILSIAWFFHQPLRRSICRLRVLALFCGLYFLIALGRSDFTHWLKGTPGYWLLLVAVAEYGWLARPRAPWTPKKIFQSIISGTLFCALWPVAFEGMTLAWPPDYPKAYFSYLHYPDAPQAASLARLGPRSIPSDELARWAGIVERMHRWAKPGEYAYVYGDFPTLYFLADLVNPTRYADLNFILSPSMEEEVIASLERNPPRVIVGEGTRGQLLIPMNGKNIAHYIQTHFYPMETFGGFVFYRPIAIDHAIQ